MDEGRKKESLFWKLVGVCLHFAEEPVSRASKRPTRKQEAADVSLCGSEPHTGAATQHPGLAAGRSFRPREVSDPRRQLPPPSPIHRLW